MHLQRQKLEQIKSEFNSFDSNILKSLNAISVKDLNVVYSSDAIEHLSELYYELGDYERPIIYNSKPEGKDHFKTYYDSNSRVIKSIDYNFNNKIHSQFFYVYGEDIIKVYEIDDNELIQLEVLVLKNGQKQEYYRYSPIADINKVDHYVYDHNTLVAINAFSSSYICNQQTEFKIIYDNNRLSEIIRIDEKSEIFPNGQTISIYKSN